MTRIEVFTEYVKTVQDNMDYANANYSILIKRLESLKNDIPDPDIIIREIQYRQQCEMDSCKRLAQMVVLARDMDGINGTDTDNNDNLIEGANGFMG